MAMNVEDRVSVFAELTVIQEKYIGSNSLSQNSPSHKHMQVYPAHMWGREITFTEQPPCARNAVVLNKCYEKI